MRQFSILLTVALLAFLISGSITNQPHSVVSASEMDCTGVTAESLGLENVEITRAELVTNDQDYPAYCLLQGNANERTGIDGKNYAIGFELLPESW